MSLNTEFYGNPVVLTNDYPELKGPGLWTKGTSQANAYTFGAFVDNNPTGYDGVIAPLDESIIPWKIGKGSDAFKRATLIPGYNETNYDLKILQATQPHKGIEDGYRFLLTYKGDERAYWNCRHSPWTTKPDYMNGAFPYERYCAPIVNFNYQTTIGIMYVLLYQKNSGSTGNYRYINLKEFLSNSTYSLENWYVTGFSYQIFVKSSSNTFRTYENLQMVNFDEYVKHPDEFVNGNVYGENYHHYLMPIVRNSQESSGTLTPANRPTIGGMYGQYTGDRDSGAPMAGREKNFKDNYNFMCAATRSTYFYTMGGYDEELAGNEFAPEYQWLINGYNYWQLLAIPKTYNSLGAKQAIYDYAMHQAAYMGFIFTIDSPTNDADKYVPEINENGVTTGEYEPFPTTTLPNKTWTDDVLDKTPYDPEGDVPDEDPNSYSDETDWTTLNIFGNFCKAYLLNDMQIETLHQKFYESLQNIPADMTVTDYFTEVFLTNNPTDVIMSLRYYHIDLGNYIATQTTENINLGAYQTDMIATLADIKPQLFDYGSCTYYPHFGDFRDYAPYSEAELIIPYCGAVKIDPAEFMGQTIKIKMGIDFMTGSCTAYILRNDLLVESVSGQMGVDIPVTAIASQDLQRDLFNNAVSVKAAKTQSAQSLATASLSFVGAAMSGNVLGMAGALEKGLFGAENSQLKIEQAEYNLEHTQIPFKQVGAAAPGINVLQEQTARLIVYRPVMDSSYSPAEYGHSVGFATLEAGTLSSYTGYTKCATVDTTGIPASAAVKNQIIKLLQSGVYL